MVGVKDNKNSCSSPETTSAGWIDWCLKKLEKYEAATGVDPFTNSVRRLAHDLFQAQNQCVIDQETLSAMYQQLSGEALIARAERFAAAHAGGAINCEGVKLLLADLEGQPFSVAQREIERVRAGIVFTGHPTFAMSADLRRAIAAYASASNDSERSAAAATISATAHAPDENISLGEEHAAAQAAVKRAQAALRDLTGEILTWARHVFPDSWTELTPQPISIASWVGYDLDGRTDIHWGETFRFRLEEKAAQLAAYAASLKVIKMGAHGAARDLIAECLEEAAALGSEQAASFDSDLGNPAFVTKAANKLTREDPRRLVSLEQVIGSLDELVGKVGDDDARLELCVVRAEMRNYGLGAGHIHLRINAAQVRSALRADLGIGQGRGFIDRTALTAAAERASVVSRRRINFASIFLEQMTARRQMMLCAEFVNHIDADTPIRFLIAECEAPATVMGAVYLARLYGVDHRLDISPLFETPEAMERGGRFIERLLAEDEYVDYIRARGRIAVQIGFSDSGRFMGQVASNLAIERLQILLARALAEKNIRDIEVVVFNTHGESMGRGGYPGLLNDRFDYLMTPWARARYAHENLTVTAESSFQGGDGFLHFATDHLAGATVAAMVQWSFAPPAADKGDRYYADINYSWDFYRSVKAWQEALFENPDYHVAIGAFAPNLLVTTGSRKTRRQSGAAITGPRSLRAIPHNAILQQLAAPANVFGGAGSAAGVEADRLVEHVRGSARMHEIMGLARKARRLTSLPVLRAYAGLFDAGFWIGKAASEDDPSTAAACEAIATRLGDQKTPTAIGRLANLYAADLAKLDRVFHELYGEQNVVERHAVRRPIHALHAIRQAMIMRAFLLVAGLPSFSARHDHTRASILDLAFELRFDELAGVLDLIFPATDGHFEAFSDIEEESDDIGGVRGYPEIQRDVIRPLGDIHRAIREIGVGISHYYDAYG